MNENNEYNFISDYAIGVYNWVSDATEPILKNTNLDYVIDSDNGSLDITIPYF